MPNNKSKLRGETTKVANELAVYEEHTRQVIDSDLVESEKDYNLVRDGTSDDLGVGVWDSDIKSFIDPMLLKALFYNDDWVFIVVDLIAKKISSQQLKVMRREVRDGQTTKVENETHAVQRTINNPNKFQDYHAWMYQLVVDLALIGNSIQWKGLSGTQLMGVPAQTIRIDFDNGGNILRYVSQQSNDEERAARKIMSFRPDEIYHLRIPNPDSMLWGLSPFVAGRRSILFNRFSSEYLNNFYLKGATPGIALEMAKEANEKVALRLLRSFEGAYTGRRNQRRTMVLPKGVTAKEMSHTLADQQLSVYIDKNRENILALLKVPKHEVGLQAAGSLGSEEYKTSIKNFWEATLKPFCRIIEGGLTRFLSKELGGDNFLEFDLSDVPALQDDEVQKAKIAEGMLKTHTLNETRKKIYEDAPLPGGDETPSQGSGNTGGGPFGLSAGATAQNAGGNSTGLTAPVQPLEALSTKVEETKVADKVAKGKADVARFKKTNESWFKEREHKISTTAKKSMDDMEALAVRMFSDMSTVITQTARKFLKEKGFGADHTKATEAGNPRQAKLVGTAELRRRLRNALDKFEETWVDETRKALVSTVEVGYESIIQVPFNLTSQGELDALRARGQQVRLDALENRQSRAFQYINETSINKVFAAIERGIEQGKTVTEIADNLRDKFGNVEEIRGRAQTIARTEVLTAVSLGQAAAMQDAAKVIPNLKKMWITADDDRVRDSHAALDGDVLDWDAPFSNGLYFPRDPGGAPEETINCRCTLVTLPKDQMDEVSGDNLDANETE